MALRGRIRERKQRGAAYVDLLQYLLFCGFYMVVVYIQADAEGAFKVVSSVRRALLPAEPRFADPSEVLSWLVAAVAPVW